MSKNPIYNKIIANQSMHSQQINALIKKNNSLVSKMKDKAAMIKYPKIISDIKLWKIMNHQIQLMKTKIN